MTALDQLRAFISAEIAGSDGCELSEDRPLIRDGVINSIGIMKLIAFIGERFGVAFEDEDYSLDNFETLAAMRRLIERRTAAMTD